jgi:hypothetical protein
MLDLIIAFLKGARHIVIPIVSFVVGLLIGLVVLGWWLFPVQWENAGPANLAIGFQQIYLENLALRYSVDPNAASNPTYYTQALGNWPEALEVACSMASTSIFAAQLQTFITSIINPAGCTAVGTEETGGMASWLLPCVLLILALVAGGLAFVFWNRRQSGSGPNLDNIMGSSKPTVVPDMPPASADGAQMSEAVTPIASYRTTYNRGLDSFDDSFTIESGAGDFLGECGVGISESIGSGSPRSVTAFEVWLFDKNDIRTITKVIMSEYAYMDPALKAKLQPKGEPALARPDEVVVLETAALIINAKITAMSYGDDPSLPENSHFEQFAIELSAWSKDDAPTSGGGFDDFA